MTAAMTMKPRPAVMLLLNAPTSPTERYAPPRPANTPHHTSAWRRRLFTWMPVTSAAFGFSPTDRSSSPQRLRCTTHHTIGMSA